MNGVGIITLEQFFKENPVVALGFSGGLDSSYLLYAGLKHGANVKPYYVNTAFQPEFELQDAIRLAKHVGADMTILELDIFSDARIVENTPERCYFCKAVIFGAIQKQAAADGYTTLIDGTNASDDASDRLGMIALSELSVRSPLRESGITKSDIRRLSKEAGLFTWDKPAYACLATRMSTGRAITKELLYKVEKAEDALFTLGFTDFRVRVYHDAARVQFPSDQMSEALVKRAVIIQELKQYFTGIFLDLEGR